MKIGFDIDDTIIDTYDYLLDQMVEFYGVEKQDLIKNSFSYINFPEKFISSETEFIYECFEKKLKYIPLKKNAKECINKLYELGYEIHLITARSNFNNVYISTLNQMNLYGIKFTRLVCTSEKSKYCCDNEINIFVDDSIRNTMEVSNYVKNVFVFECEHNKNRSVVLKKVKDWEELFYLIIKISTKKEV